jgi:hypothetical protein
MIFEWNVTINKMHRSNVIRFHLKSYVELRKLFMKKKTKKEQDTRLSMLIEPYSPVRERKRNGKKGDREISLHYYIRVRNFFVLNR